MKLLPDELLNGVVNYLARQPWVDVNRLLVDLARLPEAPTTAPKPEPEAE